MSPLHSPRGALVAGALLASAVALLAAPAHAAGQLRDCPRLPSYEEFRPDGAQCGKLVVPLDRSGSVAGTVPINVVRVPAAKASRGTLVLLTGGPGQPAAAVSRGFVHLLPEAVREHHDLVLVDQRGTGGSGAVACPRPTTPERVAACGRELGERRAFWTTKETAHDIDDVRAALGVERISLLAISYGGTVAGEYARRFPARVASMVLDSPAPVDGIDVTRDMLGLAIPRVLRDVCARGRCRSLPSDPLTALAALSQRLERRALRGRFVLASGRTRPARVTAAELYELVAASDVDPILRGALPAAIASGAEGDAAPLLRLLRTPAEAAAYEGDTSMNTARFLATICVEGRLPWAPESDPSTREAALAAAFASAPAERFAPFGAATVAERSAAKLCLPWPSTPRPEPVPSQGPDVPVLVLAGGHDLRTPVEDARRIAAQYPRGTVLAVPGVGHGVLGADATRCATNAVAAFLGGRPVRPCARRANPVSVVPYLPASLSDLRPAPGTRGAPGRVATAVRLTMGHVRRRFPDLPHGERGKRLLGLRGGVTTAPPSGLRNAVYVLRRYQVIEGVRLSGRGRGRRLDLTVTAPGGITGRLALRGDTARGTIGGQAVRFALD